MYKGRLMWQDQDIAWWKINFKNKDSSKHPGRKNRSHVRKEKSYRVPTSPWCLKSGDNETTFLEYLRAKDVTEGFYMQPSCHER